MEDSATITKKSASNLALAFVLLPKERRDAMVALYAFCREVDDVADEDASPIEDRRKELERWRSDIARVYANQEPEITVNRELAPVIARYNLPRQHFDELLDGVVSDLEITRCPTVEDLDLYCYRVASAVGLLSVRIFGYTNPQCVDYAISLGKALQLTNILRDVRNDAERGRIYLPLTDLAAAGVAETDILEGRYTEAYEKAASASARRAEGHYAEARSLLPPEDRASMVSAELMGAVYWRLFEKLRELRYDVLTRPKVRLSKWEKARLILRTAVRSKLGSSRPHYGPDTTVYGP